MQAVRSILRASPQMMKSVVPQRNMSVISTPARNKVSKGEIILLAGTMVVGWMAIPAWVLCNMKNYREHE